MQLEQPKEKFAGAPAVAQQDWRHLGAAGMQGPFLARHSGLGIWRCRSCGLGRNCSLGLKV